MSFEAKPACQNRMFSGQSFETQEASILGPSDFVPKLTLCETLMTHLPMLSAGGYGDWQATTRAKAGDH
jgi:hypothetical protein